MRGSPEAYIVGGAMLLFIDIWGISEGRLPLKGRIDTALDLAQNPSLFWSYSIALGALGLGAMLWGFIRRFS